MTLSIDLRYDAIQHIVERYVEQMTTKDLIQYFVDDQTEILSEESDSELLVQLEDVCTQEEWEDFQSAMQIEEALVG
jgi:hypothetical protein